MLSFNDAIHSPEPTVSCDVCHDVILTSQAHWYEWDGAQSGSLAWSDTVLVVPVCFSCHMNPTAWLPSASSVNSGDGGGYLASRDCECLDGPRDWS